jgi:transposase-like protein
MTTPSPKYTPELKERAVQLYRGTEGTTFASVGRELGIGPGSITA